MALYLSAFVLQMLKDKDRLGSEYGWTSFRVLLLQDIAVIPLLVAIPIFAGGEKSVGGGACIVVCPGGFGVGYHCLVW